MDWNFYYEGPIAPTQDLNCVTCLAAARKSCPTHAQNFQDGCDHCAAAKGAPCRGHWGLKAALGSAVISEDAAAEDFAHAAALTLTEAAECEQKTIRVRLRGEGHLHDYGHREVHIELSVR